MLTPAGHVKAVPGPTRNPVPSRCSEGAAPIRLTPPTTIRFLEVIGQVVVGLQPRSRAGGWARSR